MLEGFSLSCRVTAVPWVGEDSGPLGLSWQFTASDVLLWGAVGGGTLLFCVVATCCFVQLTSNREQQRAKALLAIDSALRGHHLLKATTATKKKKKKKKKGAEEEEEDDDDGSGRRCRTSRKPRPCRRVKVAARKIQGERVSRTSESPTSKRPLPCCAPRPPRTA